MPSASVPSSLFSDRARSWKVFLALALTAFLGLGFLEGPTQGGSSFVGLALDDPLYDAGGKPSGPEVVQVRELRPRGGFRAEKFGVSLEFFLGPSSPKELEEAALRPGDYVKPVALHRGGNRFELLSLEPVPHRRLKFLVSGAAVVFLAFLFPVYFRWSAGALRPRGSGAPPPDRSGR